MASAPNRRPRFLILSLMIPVMPNRLTGIFLIKVQASAVGGETGVGNKFLGLLNGGKPVVLEHVFFDDDAVDVVGAAVQPEFT